MARKLLPCVVKHRPRPVSFLILTTRIGPAFCKGTPVGIQDRRAHGDGAHRVSKHARGMEGWHGTHGRSRRLPKGCQLGESSYPETSQQRPAHLVKLVTQVPQFEEVTWGDGGGGSVDVLPSRVDGALVGAAERDHDRCGTEHFWGKRLGEVVCKGHAHLVQDRLETSLELHCGIDASRPRQGPLACMARGEGAGQRREEVVPFANKNQNGASVVKVSFRDSEGRKSGSGIPLGDKVHIVGKAGSGGVLLVGACQEPLDRFVSEHAREFLREPPERRAKCELVIDAERVTDNQVIKGDGGFGHGSRLHLGLGVVGRVMIIAVRRLRWCSLNSRGAEQVSAQRSRLGYGLIRARKPVALACTLGGRLRRPPDQLGRHYVEHY